MILSARSIRGMMFSIPPGEATFARRGFRSRDASVREHLERIGATFLQGYHAAVEEDAPETLDARLSEVEAALRGFAFEGAAMALTLRDGLAPWGRSRLGRFLEGAGDAHAYMVHVGVGWAWARLPWMRASLGRSLAKLDPLLRWLAVDGYGFHEGYFHAARVVDRGAIPRGVRGYARRAFDQGLGRSLWFVDGADAERIPSTISGFAPTRHGDLWAGIGLACTYAGGIDAADLQALSKAAGAYRPQLAQGAAFAAKARQRAGNMVPHTELACEILCGLPASGAARVTDEALHSLPDDADLPAFEVWRRRIQSQLTRELVTS